MSLYNTGLVSLQLFILEKQLSPVLHKLVLDREQASHLPPQISPSLGTNSKAWDKNRCGIFMSSVLPMGLLEKGRIRTPCASSQSMRLMSLSSTQIFMINLKRRKDRRDRMLRTLYEQEIAVKIVEAVDGK